MSFRHVAFVIFAFIVHLSKLAERLNPRASGVDSLKTNNEATSNPARFSLLFAEPPQMLVAYIAIVIATPSHEPSGRRKASNLHSIAHTDYGRYLGVFLIRAVLHHAARLAISVSWPSSGLLFRQA
jgi:hypothetical protein